MDDQALGFFPSFLGVFIFVMAIVYHYAMAETKCRSN